MGLVFIAVPIAKSLENALIKLDDNMPIQVQQEVVADKFLNLQYQIDQQEVKTSSCHRTNLRWFCSSR